MSIQNTASLLTSNKFESRLCRLCSSPWFNFLLQSWKPPRCLNLMKFPKICCTPSIVSAEYRLPSFDYFISESLNIVMMCDKICPPPYSFSRTPPPLLTFLFKNMCLKKSKSVLRQHLKKLLGCLGKNAWSFLTIVAQKVISLMYFSNSFTNISLIL